MMSCKARHLWAALILLTSDKACRIDCQNICMSLLAKSAAWEAP